jgi:hypothetical protein
VYMVPSRYATGRVPFVIYREALLSPEQPAVPENANSSEHAVNMWEMDADFEPNLTATVDLGAQCIACDCGNDGDDAPWYEAFTCHTYQPTECYCEGRAECWWCNVEAEEMLIGNDDSLIDCLAPEDMDELEDAHANTWHANRWMETSYEPNSPCATPDAVDMYAQLGFDFLA